MPSGEEVCDGRRGDIMITLGYKLSSEEQPAPDLVRQAQMAEDTGFGFALISDHDHPWIERQGQSRRAPR
jgi:alkanesulfonate monooxygenase SsuD/methylene tetrahydromethanopterin reductase-like flavin-dependent oxidoreductase (luciferase family)